MSVLAEVYERIGKLGEGTYGIVYQAQHRLTKEMVALKRMIPVSDAEGIPGTTMREIAFLRELRHPNIVNLKDVVFDVPKLTLVFECCDMDLAKYLRSRPYRQLPGDEIRLLMRQFLLGLAHMHSRSVIHRDLKPHNLLLSDGCRTLKVADFGLSRIYGIPVKKYRHDAVTLWYRPPDLILGSIMYGFGIDIWSAGCIFAEMLSGSIFIQGKGDTDHLASIFDMFGYPSKILGPAGGGLSRGNSLTSYVVPHPPTHHATSPSIGGAGNDDNQVPVPPSQPPEGSHSPRAASNCGLPSFSKPRSPSVSSSSAFPMSSPPMMTFSNPNAQPTDDMMERSLSDDPFPSFYKLPNVDTLMEKGLAARAKQSLLDPAWRPGFDNWVRKYNVIDKVGLEGVDLLRQMLQLEPGRRITAADALQHSFFNPDCIASSASTMVVGESPHPAAPHATADRPTAPTTALDMLWGWLPFASDGVSSGDAGAGEYASAPHMGEATLPEAARSYNSHNSQPRIPVPPRRSASDANLSSQEVLSGSLPMAPPAPSADGPSPLRTAAVVQPPLNARLMSGSWTHHQSQNNDTTLRRGTSSGSMTQLVSNTDQELEFSHVSGAHAGPSFGKDVFLQSYGEHSNATATSGLAGASVSGTSEPTPTSCAAAVAPPPAEPRPTGVDSAPQDDETVDQICPT